MHAFLDQLARGQQRRTYCIMNFEVNIVLYIQLYIIWCWSEIIFESILNWKIIPDSEKAQDALCHINTIKKY